MRFKLTVKKGIVTVFSVVGMDKPEDAFKLSDLSMVPSLEADLEKLLGFRFHIEEATEEDMAKVKPKTPYDHGYRAYKLGIQRNCELKGTKESQAEWYRGWDDASKEV